MEIGHFRWSIVTCTENWLLVFKYSASIYTALGFNGSTVLSPGGRKVGPPGSKLFNISRFQTKYVVTYFSYKTVYFGGSTTTVGPVPSSQDCQSAASRWPRVPCIVINVVQAARASLHCIIQLYTILLLSRYVQAGLICSMSVLYLTSRTVSDYGLEGRGSIPDKGREFFL
jgi:hypothetical protein